MAAESIKITEDAPELVSHEVRGIADDEAGITQHDRAANDDLVLP